MCRRPKGVPLNVVARDRGRAAERAASGYQYGAPQGGGVCVPYVDVDLLVDVRAPLSPCPRPRSRWDNLCDLWKIESSTYSFTDGRNIDIKHSTHKSVKIFLKAAAKEGLVKLKETKGEIVITGAPIVELVTGILVGASCAPSYVRKSAAFCVRRIHCDLAIVDPPQPKDHKRRPSCSRQH